MSPQTDSESALLAHVVSQIEQNVNFLASQNYLSQGDAASILTKLPNVNVNNGLSNLNFSIARAVPPPPRPKFAIPEPESALPRVRAIWPYQGEDPDDLQFQAGDVIDIVEEINSDWCRGRLNGREGLIPSSYVEKIMSVGKSTKPYKPFGAAYHGLANPSPTPQVYDVGLQEKPGTEEKKSKASGYKNTLAHAAVGGAGFGAGAAVAGGLVSAIF